MADCPAYEGDTSGKGLGMRRISLLFVVALWPSIAQAQLRAADGFSLLDSGDVAGAVSIWTPLAARGDLLAQFNLGVLALQGQAGLLPSQADGFFRAAAEQGYGPAQLALADLAVDQQDWAIAQDWYQAAATGGDARAQFMLGRITDDGLVGPADAGLAAQWYERAAEQAFVPAQLALGRLLVEQGDAAAGAKWLERAALAGNVAAQFDMGLLLAMGDGAAPDLTAARGWYLRAARAGDRLSMRNLSLMQARGLGGPRNFVSALAWALLAQQDGADLTDALHEVMSTEDQAKATEMAQTCLRVDAAACD